MSIFNKYFIRLCDFKFEIISFLSHRQRAIEQDGGSASGVHYKQITAE